MPGSDDFWETRLAEVGEGLGMGYRTLPGFVRVLQIFLVLFSDKIAAEADYGRARNSMQAWIIAWVA